LSTISHVNYLFSCIRNILITYLLTYLRYILTYLFPYLFISLYSHSLEVINVKMSTISVVVSEILVLPVCWRPCWIWGRDRRRATSAVPPVDASSRKSGCSRRNFDDICRSFGDTGTSGLLAAMLDLGERSTSVDVGSASSGRVEPEKRV